MDQRRTERSVDEDAFRWMAAHLPAGAQLVTYNDPVLFLYTGRRAASLTVSSMYWYRDDLASVRRAYAKLSDFARAHRLDYAYYTDFDFRRDMSDADRAQVMEDIQHNPDLEVVQRFPSATLYRVLPSR
jgi:hypothetical protein